jgi:AbrB family looped-hinge helix DNA binding protein
MKITTKGQVTIPQAVREQAGLHPHSEVSFEVLASGDVLMRRAAPRAAGFARISATRAAFERVRGSANAAEFKGMGTDEFMAFLRA